MTTRLLFLLPLRESVRGREFGSVRLDGAEYLP